MSKGGRWLGEPQFFIDIKDWDRCNRCLQRLDDEEAAKICSSHNWSYDQALRHCSNQVDPRNYWERFIG